MVSEARVSVPLRTIGMRLNPSLGGIWSRSRQDGDPICGGPTVLILLWVEYGLGVNNNEQPAET